MTDTMTTTSNGNGFSAPVRNRYFYGKLLDVHHLEMEQRYFLEASHLINRLTLGSGVLCGLRVEALEDGRVAVSPGVAVDVNPDKLGLARRLGATHTINSKTADPVAEVLKVCQGGSDFAIEATGLAPVMRQALACVRNQGGTAVVIGNARFGTTLELDPREFNMGKRLLGTWGGDNVPDRDYPRYCKLLSVGRLNLEPLLSKSYTLTDVNAALGDLEQGKVSDVVLCPCRPAGVRSGVARA